MTLLGAGVLVAGAAGLTAVAPPAQATAVEHEVSCRPPLLGGPDFVWKPKVELSVSPPKQGTYKVGEEVTVTWHWVGPPRNPWTWTGVLPDVETPNATVKLSNAQVGDISLTGPAKHPGVGGAQPLPVADLTGRFTIATEGRIDFAPGAYVLKQTAIRDSPCTPVHPDRLPVSASIQVGITQTPGPGGNGGSSNGGSGNGGASGNAGGTTGTPSAPPPSGATANPTAGTVGDPTLGGAGATPDPLGGTGTTPPSSTPPLPPPPTGQVPQTPVNTVAGPLFMRQDSAGVTMPQFQPNGDAQQLEGRLNPVSILDRRGSTLGWTLTAQSSDFVGQAGEIIPATRLSWIPACITVEGPPATVGTGVPGTIGGSAEVLCRQNPSAGAVTGGAFEANALLNLSLPGGSRSDTYTGNLTLSLS
ncbi:WxL domain-containing protein [Embleya sp. NBC_00888]|uniref:hypothetical protein n=1 Tax=Embleya sp. NBC_00888 TaxID=2975960 RepID=UPI003869AFA2|nr:WxL domain-containing protein [Embleya sp. NBC_00888]